MDRNEVVEQLREYTHGDDFQRAVEQAEAMLRVDGTRIQLLEAVFEQARRALRYHGVHDLNFADAMMRLDQAVERVKRLDEGAGGNNG